MEVKKGLAILLLIPGIVLILSEAYNTEIKENFREAIQVFSFNLLSYNVTFILLYTLSLVIPIFVMILIFADIYAKAATFREFFVNIVMRHLFYGYLTLFIIYIVDVVNDNIFLGTSSIKKMENYNEWHKYILHVLLTPIFFIDSIYSIEIEKIKHVEKDKSKEYGRGYYYFALIFFVAYLIYALLTCHSLH